MHNFMPWLSPVSIILVRYLPFTSSNKFPESDILNLFLWELGHLVVGIIVFFIVRYKNIERFQREFDEEP